MYDVTLDRIVVDRHLLKVDLVASDWLEHPAMITIRPQIHVALCAISEGHAGVEVWEGFNSLNPYYFFSNRGMARSSQIRAAVKVAISL